MLRDGPLQKLMCGVGGGAGGRRTKKYSRKGKLNEKNSRTPINPKKYSCYGLKKIHTRNVIRKKNSYGSKIPHPPPPHNFSNGPSLTKPRVDTTNREWYSWCTKPRYYWYSDIIVLWRWRPTVRSLNAAINCEINDKRVQQYTNDDEYNFSFNL